MHIMSVIVSMHVIVCGHVCVCVNVCVRKRDRQSEHVIGINLIVIMCNLLLIFCKNLAF